MRTILARGERLTERVTFTPHVQVRFDRTDEAGRPAGWIENVLSDGERGLLLTFVLNIILPGVEPGGDEEQRRGAAIRQSYVDAIEATLRMTRTLARDGALAAGR